MASNTNNTKNSHHIRSASYPPDQSNSKVLLKLIDQKINDLQKLEASSTSPMESIGIGFSGLAALYKLCTTQSHDGLLFQHQPNVESISISHLLLPICCSSRDLVLKFRQGIAHLMSSSHADASNIVSSYLSLRKQTARRARELRSSLRHLESSLVSSSYTMTNNINSNNDDDEQIKMRRVLECVSIINISVLDSLLHLLALPFSKPNKSYFKFSLFPKLRVPKMSSIVKPQVVRDEKEMGNELTNVDIALHSHSVLSSDAQQRLEALQVALEGIQDGLHSIASHLSQIRTSLVNKLV